MNSLEVLLDKILDPLNRNSTQIPNQAWNLES